MSTTTTKPAGRAELKGGLVALSFAAIVGGWAALTSGQSPQTDAQAAPPPPADPPAQPQARVQSVDLPPIPTVVPLTALLSALPAGQFPLIPSVADAPMLSALASGVPSTVAAPVPSFTAPSAPPVVTTPAPSFTMPAAPSMASQPLVYTQQRSAPSYPTRIRTRSSR